MTPVIGRFRYRGRMRLFNRETKRPESLRGEAVADVLRLAAARIDEIVKASDRAAADIRSASSERLTTKSGDGGQITRERIVAELAASLVERADGLRAEAAQLADVLTRASGRLGAAPGPAGPAAEAMPTPESPDLTRRVSERFGSATAEESDRAPGSRVPFKRRASTSAPAKQEGRKPSNDGLRLLATQMAVAGSSRDEIESRLRSEFGVQDPSDIFSGIQIPGSR